MSTEQPKPVPRKPRVRTQSHPDPQLSNQHGPGQLEQSFDQMNLEDTKIEMQRLNEQIGKLKQEEQRLREVISQLQHQPSTLQDGDSQAALKQKERELMEREHEFNIHQERFRSEVSDKEFMLNGREFELRRLEDQLTAQKKEMALAKFDEECQGSTMSSAQLAKIADKEIALQKQEERLQQKEMELNEWALRLDRQAKDNQRRLTEIQQREANVHVATTYPGGEVPTPPHPQWGGETTGHQTYPSTSNTYYQQGQGQSPSGNGYTRTQPAQQWYPPDSSTPTQPTEYSPHTPNTSTVVGTHSGSPGYQHYPQQQHQEPFNKYQQSSGIYQQPPLPGPGMVLGAGGAGMAYSSQTQVSGTPATGSSSQLAGSSGSGVVFSVGEGGTDRNNLGASSSSNSVASASAMSATNYHSGGRPTATPRTLNQSEECARGLQWEEQSKAKHQEDSDLELARRLQEEFDAEVRNTQQHQQHAASADELLALQLQHEDLKEGYGSGLTHNNQLTGESSGGEVTEVVKKVLDERMTRQHQIREQEEADRRIAETISANDLGDPALQANVQNNLSS